jgi:hypothetical protein
MFIVFNVENAPFSSDFKKLGSSPYFIAAISEGVTFCHVVLRVSVYILFS